MRAAGALLLAGLALAACQMDARSWGVSGSLVSGVGREMRAGTFAPLALAAAEALADDGAAMVAQLAPPGGPRLVFQQGEESDLGYELEQRLRQRGYAVDVGGHGDVEEGTMVRFAFDEAAGLYRLTLVVWPIGDSDYTVVSRAYKVKRGVVYPVGAWSKRGGEA